jgi:hypothetical protein
MKNSNDIHLQLQYKVNIKQESSSVMWISGCTILPDGKILIADCRAKRQLMQYGKQGTSYLAIPISGNPFDLTLIDTERVGISYSLSFILYGGCLFTVFYIHRASFCMVVVFLQYFIFIELHFVWWLSFYSILYSFSNTVKRQPPYKMKLNEYKIL